MKDYLEMVQKLCKLYDKEEDCDDKPIHMLKKSHIQIFLQFTQIKSNFVESGKNKFEEESQYQIWKEEEPERLQDIEKTISSMGFTDK